MNQLIIRNVVSPYGLATVSYLIFFIAWVFPPDVYSKYLVEPDLMFLDPLTIAFYTACVVFYLLGVRSWRFFASNSKSEEEYTFKPSIIYYLLPLAAGVILCCIRLIKLGGHVDFVSLIESQQGSTLKQVLHSGTLEDGQWAMTIMVLTGVIWWALYRYKEFGLHGANRWVFLICFLGALLVDVLTCVASLDRTSLMPLIAGLPIIILYANVRGRTIKLSKLISIAGSFMSMVVGLFLALAFVRGANAENRLITSFLGYTIASYTRLTALLTGVMSYQYGGKGAYLVPYMTESSTFNAITGLADRLSWPSSSELWNSEFTSTLGAGLNVQYIWAGTFGYLYADLGWFALFYLLLVGLISGFIWDKFKQGKPIGLVLYPWVAFCILFWLGWNPLFDGHFMTFLLTAIALNVYDFVALRRTGVSSRPANLASSITAATPHWSR